MLSGWQPFSNLSARWFGSQELDANERGESYGGTLNSRQTKLFGEHMKYSAIVSAYFPSRKYGFLLLDDGTSRFFHLSNCPLGVPILGQRVTFELGEPVKLGQHKQAVDIRPVIDAQSTSTTEVQS
jgi:cold shock CspA family protein